MTVGIIVRVVTSEPRPGLPSSAVDTRGRPRRRRSFPAMELALCSGTVARAPIFSLYTEHLGYSPQVQLAATTGKNYTPVKINENIRLLFPATT
mgnify:CR=1 FL=1